MKLTTLLRWLFWPVDIALSVVLILADFCVFMATGKKQQAWFIIGLPNSKH